MNTHFSDTPALLRPVNTGYYTVTSRILPIYEQINWCYIENEFVQCSNRWKSVLLIESDFEHTLLRPANTRYYTVTTVILPTNEQINWCYMENEFVRCSNRWKSLLLIESEFEHMLLRHSSTPTTGQYRLFHSN